MPIAQFECHSVPLVYTILFHQDTLSSLKVHYSRPSPPDTLQPLALHPSTPLNLHPSRFQRCFLTRNYEESHRAHFRDISPWL